MAYEKVTIMLPSIEQLGHMLEIRAGRMDKIYDTTLLSLLWKFRSNGASDPRDKVYSLLGLLEPPDETQARTSESVGYDPGFLLLDYNAPPEGVYKSLVKAVIAATGNLNVICASQPSRDFERLDLPTWTPDWSQEWHLPNGVLDSTSSLESPTPSRQASQDVNALVHFSKDLNVLTINAIIVDEVEEIWARLDVSHDSGSEYIKMVQEWRKKESYGIYGTADRAYDAHWRSLVCNSSHNSDFKRTSPAWAPMDETWGADFEAWITSSVAPDMESANFCNRADFLATNRRTIMSKKGYFILGPDVAKADDFICVLLGCNVPVCLRPFGDYFEFVGECYVHGIME